MSGGKTLNAPATILVIKAKARRLPETWSVHDDNRLRDTKGQCAKIRKMSDADGIAETALMARWHLLRRGDCGTPREMRDGRVCKTARELANKFRGRAIGQILEAFAKQPELSCDDIARRSNSSRERVCETMLRARDEMAAFGWRVMRTGRSQYRLERIAA